MTSAAWFTLLGSVLVSLISAFIALRVAFSNQRAQIDIERLKTDLAQQSKERDARRDYEYEARKRLYEEFEPLMFKLVEQCDEAWHRIASLARSARRRDITPSNGWLFSPDGYYMLSTLYKLMAPMAVIHLLRDKLTLVDLSLEERIRHQYYLAKALERAFTDDFAIAGREPKLRYAPEGATDRDRERNPSVAWRQGLFLGRVHKAAEAMIVREDGAPPSLMSYGKFESEYLDKRSPVADAFEPVANIFFGFHPETRPVLWRVLVTQAVMLRTFAGIGDVDRTAPFDPLRPLTNDEAARLRWWTTDLPPDGAGDVTLAIAREHIRETYRQISGA